jgi:hypothetical protein
MSVDTCPVCNHKKIENAIERQTHMCSSCATVLGVVPLPPPPRPKVPCRACNGLRFVRAIPREVAPWVGNEEHQVTCPMTVTFGGVYELGSRRLIADPRRSFGQLEMYVCKGCGLVEWYCSDPERIPVGPHFMTEEIDHGAVAEGPYR